MSNITINVRYITDGPPGNGIDCTGWVKHPPQATLNPGDNMEQEKVCRQGPSHAQHSARRKTRQHIPHNNYNARGCDVRVRAVFNSKKGTTCTESRHIKEG